MFTAYLPANRACPLTPSELPPGELPQGQGELLLLVDDETMVLDMAAATLQSHGYRVVTAAGGAGAVDLYRQQRHEIRAAIVDMMMPGMDGQATIRALREIDPQVRIISSSGLRRRSRGPALPEGTRAFLPKPYSDSQLLVTLRQVLDADDET